MKKMMTKYSLIFGLILLPFLTEAQVKNELSSLIRQTLAYHPQIKQQQEGLKIADYRTEISQSQYLPQVALDNSYNYLNPVAKRSFGAPGNESVLQFQPYHNFQTALTVNQLLYDFGKTGTQVQKSKLDKELSSQGLDNTELQFAYQIARLYFGQAYLLKAIDVQKAQIQLQLENEQLISDKIKDGDEIEYNLIATQVRRKNAEIRLADLENQYQRQMIQLQSLSGNQQISIDKNMDFQGLLPEISQEGGLGSNPDVKISRLQEEIALQELKTARKGVLPSLNLQGSVGYKNGYQPNIYTFRFNYLIGVRLFVPLFTGFRNHYQIEVGESNYQLRKFATESQELTTKTGFEQAYVDYQTAREKLLRAEAQVEQAKYALELADVRYQNGIITSLDVSTAQTSLLEAQLNRVNYEYQSLLAKLEWHRLSATKFWE